MKRVRRQKASWLILCLGLTAILSGDVPAQPGKLFLGVKLRPEVQALADEVERKTRRKIYAEFTEFEDGASTLGISYLSENRTPVVRVNSEFQNQPSKIESIVAHELLHLRLRADGYPVFLFSSSVKTRRGLAQDVEQSNVNDLASMIEHRVFKTEMERFGLNRIIDLAGDTERGARRRKGEQDGQSDAINFARAVLEYQASADVENLRRIYLANKWQRSLRTGQEIADIINRARIDSPSAAAAVFRLCVSKLYPPPRPFKLYPDKSVTAYNQLLIGF